MMKKSDGGKSAAGGVSSTTRASSSAQSVLSTASRVTREPSDLRAQMESRRNDASWLSNDASAIVLPSSFDASNDGTNESKIVDIALHDNGACANVASNDGVDYT